MLFVTIIAVLVLAYLVQMKIYQKRTFEKLESKTTLDATEASVGDDIYMYEELTNNKALPLPYLKVTSKLPEGMSFRLVIDEDGKSKEVLADSVDSMFVVKGRQRITRRWRIACRKRGIYTLGDALIVAFVCALEKG